MFFVRTWNIWHLFVTPKICTHIECYKSTLAWDMCSNLSSECSHHITFFLPLYLPLSSHHITSHHRYSKWVSCTSAVYPVETQSPPPLCAQAHMLAVMLRYGFLLHLANFLSFFLSLMQSFSLFHHNLSFTLLTLLQSVLHLAVIFHYSSYFSPIPPPPPPVFALPFVYLLFHRHFLIRPILFSPIMSCTTLAYSTYFHLQHNLLLLPPLQIRTDLDGVTHLAIAFPVPAGLAGKNRIRIGPVYEHLLRFASTVRWPVLYICS